MKPRSLEKLSDVALWGLACADGDESSEAQAAATFILERYQPILAGYLMNRYGEKKEQAYEMTQQAFAQALASRSFSGKGRLLSWLLAIAVNVRRDWYRQQAAQPPMEPLEKARNVATTEASALDELLGRESHERLREALATLTHTEKKVTSLSLDGWSNLDIAAELGIARSTVRSHLSQGVQKLRSALQAGRTNPSGEASHA